MIVFFADDMGWGDMGANWDQYRSVTVNLNKLAESGMRFVNHISKRELREISIPPGSQIFMLVLPYADRLARHS